MREARVPGCRDSSIAPAGRCGKPSETEMETLFRAPGWCPAVGRVVWPKASAREFHQQQKVVLTGRPSSATGWATRVLIAVGGPAPIAPGANSVASALGAPPGATPAELC